MSFQISVAAPGNVKLKVVHEVWEEGSLVDQGLVEGWSAILSSLKTYLWRVTSNACVDRVRSQHKVQWEELDSVDQAPDGPARLATERARGGEAHDLLLRVLAEMPQECIDLWRMIVQGYSYRQMSRASGASEGALRVRVLRCRRRAAAVRAELLGVGASTPGNGTAP